MGFSFLGFFVLVLSSYDAVFPSKGILQYFWDATSTHKPGAETRFRCKCEAAAEFSVKTENNLLNKTVKPSRTKSV